MESLFGGISAAVLHPLRPIGGQASVNSKVETVEDLRDRRRRLHVGMCKLVKEDVALEAERILTDAEVRVMVL